MCHFFFYKKSCSPCLTGKGLGWGKGYKTACGACRVGQSFRMLSHVCLVLDLEGFKVQGQFLVRELGWCDWTGQHWGTTHYYPTRPYPEAWKDQRLIRFVRRHVHGLPYTPAHREQARPAAHLEQDVKDLVHKFQQPDKMVVAYKGGHYEKELLQRWGIPHFNLEQAQCPKFDTMTRLCRPTSCGCHDHPWRHHCPQTECYHFVHWMRGQLDTFNTLFSEILNEHALVKRIKIKSRPNSFVTPEIRQLMKTRDKWHKRVITTNDRLHWNAYRFFRQEVKRELRLAEKCHVRSEILNSKHNTNAIWKIINRCLPKKTHRHPNITSDQYVLANKFNEYFSSVGSLTAQKACELAHVHNFCVSPEMPGSVSISADDCDLFQFQMVSEKEVEHVVKNIPPNKAPGIDKVSARVLKDSLQLHFLPSQEL